MANIDNLKVLAAALAAYAAGKSLRLYLCGSGYTYSAAHFASDIVTADDIIGDPTDLTGLAIDADTGAVSADDPTVENVPASETITQALFVWWTGTAGTSPVWLRIDTDSSPGAIALATDGNNVEVTLPAALFSFV